VSDFTTAYNDIIEFVNQEFAFNEDSGKAGILSGESTLRTIKSIIQSTVSNSISLLPADANALSLIGISSDKFGKLSVKDSTFLSEINSDFYAVKRMFVAEGTTTDNEISYVSHTKDTVAGNYAVTINTVATQASRTGSIVLTNGIGAGLTETLTITDTSTNRVATISLDGNASQNGSSIDNIVNAINSELDTERTQTLVGSVANSKTTAAGGGLTTGSTKFNEIDTGGDANDLSDNDIISFTGTTRTGRSINNSYTISDVSTDTVQDFLSAIEKAYENSVSATINASGEIVLTDITDGDSQLSITITEPGSLDFGTVLTSNTGGVTGRYAMEITASKDGSDQLVLTHDSYGSGFGFTTDETNDLLGTEGTYAGVDVAGTINGEAATGTGQILVGDAPPDISSSTSVEDLTIKVTSTTTGSKGNVKLTMGVGERMFNDIDSIIDQFDGLLTIRMDGLQDTIDNMQKSILAMEGRLAMETLRLNQQFVALELNLSKLQSISSFMSQQLAQIAR
jgi:flagellar hook-associated protein 2